MKSLNSFKNSFYDIKYFGELFHTVFALPKNVLSVTFNPILLFAACYEKESSK